MWCNADQGENFYREKDIGYVCRRGKSGKILEREEMSRRRRAKKEGNGMEYPVKSLDATLYHTR